MSHFRPHSLALFLAVACLAVPVVARAADDAPKQLNRSATPAPGEKKLDWLAFDAATERAAKEGKHVIVDIYTTWCGWCKVMDRETYGNAEVADYLKQNFVLAKVNGESSSRIHWRGKEMTERQFAREVGVTGFPATYFLKPDSELLGGMPGFIRAKEFILVARYVNTKWYEKGKLADYMKEQGTAGGATGGASSPAK